MITSALSSAQTVSTITGTIKDLTGANVTSGKVTFELRPALDTVMSGIARFTPITVTCYINGSGLVKAIDLSSPCLLVQNTSLTPNGTWYAARICPQNACSSAFTFYNYSTPIDISSVPPTPTTSPAYSFVDLIANQTIGGNKTFTGSTVFTGSTTFGGTTTITGSVIAAFFASQGLPHVASAGTVRLATSDSILFRDFGDTTNINGLSHDSSDRMVVGGTAGLFTSRVTSSTANPAASGWLRMAASDQACFRNAGNTADVCMSKDGSDRFSFTSFSASIFASTTANPAASGIIRLAAADQICFRNAGNTADVCIGKDAFDSISGFGYRFVNSDYSLTTIASFTTTTTIKTFLLPATDLNVVNRGLTIHAHGNFDNSSGIAVTYSPQIKIDSTIVCDGTGISVATGTVRPWDIDCEVGVVTAGAGGTIRSGGMTMSGSATSDAPLIAGLSTTLALDTTVSHNVIVSATSSSSNANAKASAWMFTIVRTGL